jgi:hypothetical protein
MKRAAGCPPSLILIQLVESSSRTKQVWDDYIRQVFFRIFPLGQIVDYISFIKLGGIRVQFGYKYAATAW